MNLAGNALHYSPAASPLLTARTAGNRVELRVADHGPGIPAADRKRLVCCHGSAAIHVANEPAQPG